MQEDVEIVEVLNNMKKKIICDNTIKRIAEKNYRIWFV